jgi:class 3 adenylate cyclase
MDAMSSTITSFALSQNTIWPQYTHPEYEVFGNSFRNTSGAQLVSISPIVADGLARDQWNLYSVDNQGWVEGGLAYIAETEGTDMPEGPYDISPEIYRRRADGEIATENGDGPFAPVWQTAAAPEDATVVNFNLLSNDVVQRSFTRVREERRVILSEVVDASEIYGGAAVVDPTDKNPGPQSLLVTPIFDGYSANDRDFVAAVVSVLPWDLYFKDLLRDGVAPIHVVVEDGKCGNSFTYEIRGSEAIYLGEGDLHDTEHTDLGMSSDFSAFSSHDECVFTYTVYPSEQFNEDFESNEPVIWTVVVVLVFVFTSAVFLMYDFVVQRRQAEAMTSAAQSNAIVSSLFPAEIRDRLFGNDDEKKDKSQVVSAMPESSKFRLKSYLNEEEKLAAANNQNGKQDPQQLISPEIAKALNMYDTKPIADLFPNTTVMFADIAGFTAWSSVREPSQVFTLLETVYRAFDSIAKRRRVFKVETVGDCYVAVTGLPEPRKDHAPVMAKFARECLEKFNELAKSLEVTLGPDTGDLALRTGLHSGPVTAGVLRGDRSRFQLFGDTVNKAARVETTGQRHRIHISSETADLLIENGKVSWVRKRPEKVNTKGKGDMQTYWLLNKDGLDDGSEHGDGVVDDMKHGINSAPKLGNNSIEQLEQSLPPKVQRLVGWNVEILKKLLQQIIAKRNASVNSSLKRANTNANNEGSLTKLEKEIARRTNCLDEVCEIITLPKFDHKAHKHQENPSKIEIPVKVVEQLRLYVASVAAMHRDNPFHNFEHASHVTMSVSKLLTRIVAPDNILNAEDDDNAKNLASSLHDHTYGITSDPLTQFSVVLSALIHDVDHSGVSNFQLIKESHKLAHFFKKKSVAEQNSIVLAWEKLMSDKFLDLRRCIYQEPSELERFRQLVANSVLATDIFDKELQAVRKNRWNKAFREHGQRTDVNLHDDVNRKATIVIEHLIQASDVAHTMQHWHIYQKWNERLFAEMSHAYQNERMGNDPADGWYQGELGFFDNYVIPLAKKLKECGVFGVSSDEYLNYALENRREWAAKGEDACAKMVEKYSKKKETKVAAPAAAESAPSSSSKPDSETKRKSLDTSNKSEAATSASTVAATEVPPESAL